VHSSHLPLKCVRLVTGTCVLVSLHECMSGRVNSNTLLLLLVSIFNSTLRFEHKGFAVVSVRVLAKWERFVLFCIRNVVSGSASDEQLGSRANASVVWVAYPCWLGSFQFWRKKKSIRHLRGRRQLKGRCDKMTFLILFIACWRWSRNCGTEWRCRLLLAQ